MVMLSMRRSMILEGVQRSEIGLYELASVGGLFGLRFVMILPTFHMRGICECW